jgi:hypothetical protein
MWASAAMLTALALAPEPMHQVKLTNDRVCHGVLGWERKDPKSPKLHPGDIYILVFDIDGLTISPTGRIKYRMGLEVRDKTGKVSFMEEPKEYEDVAALGGRRVFASAQVGLGLDTAPGTYTIKVTVTDLEVKTPSSDSLTRTFEVVPVELALVRLTITYASEHPPAIPAPPLAVPGQVFMVNFAAVGFQLDSKTMQPSLLAEMQVLDEAGKPVLEKPFKGGVNEVTEQFRKIFPMQFTLTLNRPGKFRIHLKITDQMAKKSAEYTLPFQVLEVK